MNGRRKGSPAFNDAYWDLSVNSAVLTATDHREEHCIMMKY